MKKYFKKLFILVICVALTLAGTKPQRAYATGLEVVAVGGFGAILYDLLITAFVSAGVYEVATDTELQNEIKNAFNDYLIRSSTTVIDPDNPPYPAPGPAPEIVDPDDLIDIHLEDGSVIRSAIDEMIEEAKKNGGKIPMEEPEQDKNINFAISAGVIGLIGDFIKNLANGKIENEQLNALFGNADEEHYSPQESVEGTYSYSFSRFTPVGDYYDCMYTGSITTRYPIAVYKFNGVTNGYAPIVYLGDNRFTTSINNEIIISDNVLKKYMTAYGGFKPGDTEKVTAWFAYRGEVISSAGEYHQLGYTYTSTAPIFNTEAEAKEYLRSGDDSLALNKLLLDKALLADHVADALAPLAQLESDTAISTDTLGQIRDMIKEKMDTQPDLDMDALQKAITDAVAKAIEDTKTQVQPAPSPNPDTDTGTKPGTEPSTGIDIIKEIGEGILKITIDIKLWLADIISWLKQILQAVLDIVELLKSWFNIDLEAIKAEMLSIKSTALEIPIFKQINDFGDLFNGISFSDFYDYPKIIIQTPKALLPFYNQSQIIMVDFADYATYLLWTRNILKASLYIGMGFYALKEFSVRFHIG